MVRQLEHLSVQKRGAHHCDLERPGASTSDVLAEESGQLEQVPPTGGWWHLDMMFHFFCKQGYPLGLSAAAAGMGVEGKTEGMDGKHGGA